MRIGTKSVLFGAHCFLLHPWFVALAWWQLYGFPWDPRLWVAFFVHDLGYLGKPNMDGPEGETHPEFGAAVMRALTWRTGKPEYCTAFLDELDVAAEQGWRVTSVFDEAAQLVRYRSWWGDFVLLHSRYYAKKLGLQPSRLCFADKLSFCLTPRWLYLPMVRATGELTEYLRNAQTAESTHWKPSGYDANRWHAQLCCYMRDWVAVHKGGAADTWTSSDRHARDASGVTQ